MPDDDFLKVEANILARFDELWARLREQNAAIPEDEVEQDITAAFRSVRGLRPHPLAPSPEGEGGPS